MQSQNIFESNKKLDTDKFYIIKLEIPPLSNGDLDNLTFAIKDVIDIQNQKTSCGNPLWVKTHEKASKHADCVTKLLLAGGKCIGKTVLGEFCSGSTGINHFYGMPPNPHSPLRVPGGSSSGSASIVAANVADFSLGTDVAGSVRIPASFCGVYGFRPSHKSISMEGVKSFSPSYDTIGIFANEIAIIEKVYKILTTEKMEVSNEKPKAIIIINDLMSTIPKDQRTQIEEFCKTYSASENIPLKYIDLSDVHSSAGDETIGISSIFRKLFCAEIWESLKDWIETVDLKFNDTTYVDFSFMKQASQMNLEVEKKLEKTYFNAIDNILSGNLFCIPTAPDIAPLRNLEYKKVNEFDYNKLRPLISLSSIGKLPQIHIPLEKNDNHTFGVSLLAGHNKDLFLINAAKQFLLYLNENRNNSLKI